MYRITIIGAGNFGYALLKHFDRKSKGAYLLSVYDREEEVIKHLRSTCEHPYFHRGTHVSESIRFYNRLPEAVEGADIVVLAVTSGAVAEVCGACRPALKDGVALVNTAKALDAVTGRRLSEVCGEALPDVTYIYAMLAGGMVAADLFRHEPLGADLACADLKAARWLAQVFSSDNLAVYPTTDLAGVEYASALKNVVSILAGLIHGMGLSYGSETHVITRAAHEIERVVVDEYGADRTTFAVHSQAWGNDMWMSCTGDTRNREFGILLGKGHSVTEARHFMQEQRKAVEGLQTIATLNRMTSLTDYPLLDFLSRLIAGRAQIEEVRRIIADHQF